METKQCGKCKEIKVLEHFSKGVDKNGLHMWCKSCQKNYKINWYKKNAEKAKNYSKYYGKTYRENNKEILKQRKKVYYEKNKEILNQRTKVYYEKNKKIIQEKKNIYEGKKYSEDTLYRLKHISRRRLLVALKCKNWRKNNHFSQYIGCSLDELKTHLEKQFQHGMTWGNQGKWHIDHIIPLSSAKTEEELYKLCHYTNLQPLWAEDNLKKSNKIVI